MHLYKFTKEQKIAFLGLAKKVIEADNERNINESSFFNMMNLEMGLDQDVFVEDKPLNDLLVPFNSRMTKVWLLQELMGMGYIDDYLAPEELTLLKEIAKSLGFTNDELDKIRMMVLKTKELVKETNELIRGR